MWSFEADADYQRDLDWADTFVREEIEPLEHILSHGGILDTHDAFRQHSIRCYEDHVRLTQTLVQ